MENIGDRVRKRRLALGLSQADLAKKIGGIRTSAIGNIESRGSGGGRFINKLAEALGVTIEWLQTGRTTSYIPDELGLPPESNPARDDGDSLELDHRIRPIGISSELTRNKPDFYYLRQFAIGASAGFGQVNYDIKEEDPFEISKAELIAQDINPETTFVIYVEGPSMTHPGHPNSMPDGSLIGFDRSKKKIISGKFYVVRIGDELLVKQIFQDQFTIQLRSLNPDFHPFDRVLQKSEGWQDVEILGQVKLMRPALTFF